MPNQRITSWASNPWNEVETSEAQNAYNQYAQQQLEAASQRYSGGHASYPYGGTAAQQQSSMLGRAQQAGLINASSNTPYSPFHMICEFASMCIRANITVMEMVVDDRTYHYLASELQRGSYTTRVDEARGLVRLCVNTAMGPVFIIAQSHKKVDQFDFDKYLEEVD